MQLLYSYVWILWDLLAIGIFFHCVSKYARRGFVSTIIGLLIYIVAAFAASKLYVQFSEFLYNNVIYDAVRQALVRSFNNMLNGVSPAKDIIHAMPTALRILVGFKKGEVAALPIIDASDMASDVIDIALRDPLMSILHGAGFLLIFTLVAHLMHYIARLFTGINSLPVIGLLNTVAGGIAGVAAGMIVLFVSGFTMRIIIALSGEVWWWLNSAVIQNTYIWSLFY